MTNYNLKVFNRDNKQVGSLTIIVGRSAVPTAQDPFLWQWQGKGGAGFGTWEWKLSGNDYHMVLTNVPRGTTWGSLFADWRPLPSPYVGPTQPWFSQAGIKAGDISIYYASTYFSGTWKLV